ncbi:XdhC family protein [Marisediminicola sp. LYQ134]|uniref:XdhC family protein n=1 Tax=Marisediminicola sp. LYQ134 TaxID=3391061 RepID=UPI0039834BCF
MFEIADRVLREIDAGHAVVVATAVSITGSAPRTVGSSMAVSSSGAVAGSISGGCVDGALVEMCDRVLATGRAEFAGFGFDDDAAFAVGLACGGRIEIVAVRVSTADAASAPIIAALRDAAAGRSARVSLVTSGDPSRIGEVVTSPDGCDGLTVFTDAVETPATFLIFGAVEFSVALCAAASAVGFAVTVCDPRSTFATHARFPAATEVVVEWPTDYLARVDLDERSVVCILSHDDRFDVDLIAGALARPVAYIGAMGSRATHAARVEALADRGIHDLSRLHSPIGLDIGASTPEETAVSILAEVLAARSGASGAELRARSGAIHARR